MSAPIDSISAIKNKPPVYPAVGSKNYLLDLEDRTEEEVDSIESFHEGEKKLANLPVIDTLSSANPPNEEKETVTEKTDLVKPKLFSFDSLIDISRKAWDFISSPFKGKPAVIQPIETPAAESIEAISGIPTLTPPALVNRQTAEKMRQDLIEQSYKTEESTNENKDQNFQDEQRYIFYYKAQYELRKEGILNVQFQFIFNQQKERTLRKEQSDLKAQNIELEKKRKFWSVVNTVLFAVSIAAVVAGVAITAFATAGFALPVALAALPLAVKGVAVATGMMSGGTTIIKACLDKDSAKIKGKTEIIDYKHQVQNETLKIQSAIANSENNKALEYFASLKQMLDKNQKTARFITSK